MDRFKNRADAGRRLGKLLSKYKDRDDVVVLGLPRGGVILAKEVAEQLNARLDLFIVRKLGTPRQEELAMGAIASGGVCIMNDRIVKSLGISRQEIDLVVQREMKELQRREEKYRGDREPVPLAGKTVILVDDGLATGASMKAAVGAVDALSPKAIIVAVGTTPPDTLHELEEMKETDEVIAVLKPAVFYGVGGSYENFEQTTDEEVIDCLDHSLGR